MMREMKVGHQSICSSCGHVYDGHTNIYGKICIHCGGLTKPEIEPVIVTENLAVKEKYKEIAINKVREKLTEEEQ